MRNAIELMWDERLGASSRTPFEVVASEGVAKLRHYGGAAGSPSAGPVLLIPPLMVYSEIYDISPELSAVGVLLERGVDTWLVDFGAPEHEEGGMSRTLDDHLLSIDRAIDRVVEETGRPVHLVGYSQGGIFCYQVAAFRQGRSLSSLVAFGAPVDVTRNLPLRLHDRLAGQMIRSAGRVALELFADLPGWPAVVTSGTFRLLYPANGVKHLARLVGMLPDREALERYLPKRRFLRGEGFTAWPGPAFRDFLDQVVTENRLRTGGLVVAGQAVSLGEITCPILAFHGRRDNLARPAAVRAIERAALRAEVFHIAVDSGHFGLVVGAKAVEGVWPLVAEWVRWRDGLGERPGALSEGQVGAGDAEELVGRRASGGILNGSGDEMGRAVRR